jgi:TPR repeat protein
MYENGIGGPKDTAKATQWYRKAATQGLETAQIALRKLKTNSTKK